MRKLSLKEMWKLIPVNHKFKVSSALILLGVFIGLFLLMTGVIKDYYLDLNPQFLIEEVQALAVTQLQKEDFSSYHLSEAQERFAELESTLVRKNILQMDAWNTAGRIAYSANQSRIGESFAENERFQQAMMGIAVVEIDTIPLENLTTTGMEHVKVVFVPLVYPGETEPSGLIEIHQNVETLKGILYSTRASLALLFVLSLLVIYVALNKFYVDAQRGLENAIHHLEDLNAKKNDFISITAHELKTPITVVSGYSELLLKEVKKFPKKTKERIELVGDTIRRMNKYVNEMLDISRIDLDTLDLVYGEVDVPSFLKKRVKGFQPMLKEKKLRLELECGRGVGKATIDKDRVWQVIVNLVTNSIKFSPQGKKIFLDVKKADEMLEFSVRDEGPGIAKEHQERIFERLYQVDPASTRKHGGLGLGLAICKGFVEGMGGELSLESELGKGATFTFTIPIKR